MKGLVKLESPSNHCIRVKARKARVRLLLDKTEYILVAYEHRGAIRALVVHELPGPRELLRLEEVRARVEREASRDVARLGFPVEKLEVVTLLPARMPRVDLARLARVKPGIAGARLVTGSECLEAELD